ncbi:MAG: HNH endonuclease [Bacteroidota bacterium]
MTNKRAYLFAWNPSKWRFEELEEKIQDLKTTGKAEIIWSIASHKKVRIGDRAFIMRLGSEPRGIFASGVITSEPRDLPHWSGTGLVPRVMIEFDVLINPETDPILHLSAIEKNISQQQRWLPQQSGIEIYPVQEIESLWEQFIIETGISFIADHNPSFIEGTSYQLIQIAYERNRYARQQCLKHHGYSCMVCDFNFKDTYGDIGNEFIHVHHLNQLSNTGIRNTDPISDLRPVCPNCHAMLHRKNPPFTIGELKNRLIIIK